LANDFLQILPPRVHVGLVAYHVRVAILTNTSIALRVKQFPVLARAYKREIEIKKTLHAHVTTIKVRVYKMSPQVAAVDDGYRL